MLSTTININNDGMNPGVYRIYPSKNHITPPPRKWYFSPFPQYAKIYTSRTLFGFIFATYAFILTSIYSLSFVPFLLPLFYPPPPPMTSADPDPGYLILTLGHIGTSRLIEGELGP